jgi:hypothetical protein
MADLKTKPGDLFAIPAHDKDGNVGFVICRHIGAGPPLPLFEVFSKFYTECPKSLSEVDTTTRLFRPVMMLISFHKQTIPRGNKWRILFSDPDYQPEQSGYKNIQIGFPESGHVLFGLWEGGVDKRVSKSEVLAVEDATAWQPPNLCIRVTAHLAGLIGPEETYDIWKVVGLTNTPANQEELLKRFDVLMKKGMEACEIMANRFKQWDLEKKGKGKKRALIKK